MLRGAEAIVTFDADGQHDPADLPRMLQPVLDDQADVVLGSRFLGTAANIPWARRVLLQIGLRSATAGSGLESDQRDTDSDSVQAGDVP
jgi:hypothetical protein